MTNLESDMTFPTYGGEVKPATGATLFALGSWPGRAAGGSSHGHAPPPQDKSSTDCPTLGG